jgi:heme A synthase
VATLYFTFSRGSWIALAIGLVAAVLLDNRRLQLLTGAVVLSPPLAALLWQCADARGLTRPGNLGLAVQDGHRLLGVVVAVSVVSAAVAALLALGERHVHLPRAARTTWAVVLAVAGVGSSAAPSPGPAGRST